MPAFAQSETWLSTRQLSPQLWKGVDLSRAIHDLSYGYGFLDDFVSAGDVTNWTKTTITDGDFQITAGKYGLAAVTSSSTAQRGTNLQRSLGFAPTSTGTILFEARVAFSGWGTAGQFFLGLHETDTTILTAASGALSSDDLIGYHATTTTTLTPKSQINSGSVQSGTATTISTDGTYVRYGIKVIRNTKAEFYVNGTLLGSITSTMPSANLAPSIVVQSNGTTSPIATFDWVACAFIEEDV